MYTRVLGGICGSTSTPSKNPLIRESWMRTVPALMILTPFVAVPSPLNRRTAQDHLVGRVRIDDDPRGWLS